MLATLSDLKLWLKITDTADDTLLTLLLTAVSGRFAGACDRDLEYAAAETIVFDGGENCIHLRRYPVVSLMSVKEAVDGVFTGVESLVELSDYYLDKRCGLLYRAGDCRWMSGRQTVQVVATGGYVDPATTPVPTGGTVVPADVQDAVIRQCRFEWKHRDEIGLESVGAGGGNWSLRNGEPWLAEVAKVIQRYKRY